MKLLVLALCVAFVAAAKKCTSADDCEENECCVKYFFLDEMGGNCKPMRKEGESCTPLEKKETEVPKMYHFQCPCRNGLECVAKYELEIFGHVVRHRPECVVPGKEGDGNEIVTPEAN